MTKIVINTSYAGFSLSDAALVRFYELKGVELYANDRDFGFTAYYSDPKLTQYVPRYDMDRSDLHLVQVVQEMGKDAALEGAELKIVEIPDGVEWIIESAEGTEWIAEKHRIWV